jgi:hypothetical protein
MWSYSGFHKKSSFFLVAIFVMGGISGYVVSKRDNPNHQITITLESSMPAETQLFYNTGKGFNENDSLRKVIYQANAPVTLDFNLSEQNLYGLRFDPSRSTSKIKIHEIILKYQAERPFTVPLDSLTAQKDIKFLDYDGKTLTVETTEAAIDPILLLTRIGSAPHASKLRILICTLAGAIISLLIACFIVWVYRNCMDGEKTVCERRV